MHYVFLSPILILTSTLSARVYGTIGTGFKPVFPRIVR